MQRQAVIRDAHSLDCEAVAAIYNEGITEGRSTFETHERSAADIETWLNAPAHPLLVTEDNNTIAGWARIAPYSARPCYAGIVEASVYVQASARGHGLGSALAASLRARAEQAGHHKIVGKLFAENAQSRRLAARHDFREVGVHLQHGLVGGDWHDVMVIELLLDDARQAESAIGGAALPTTRRASRA